MKKPIKFISNSGDEISSEELNGAFDFLFDKSKLSDSDIENSPKDLREFDDRIGQFLYGLKRLFFGLTYDVETGKTLKKAKDAESLVGALLSYEKHLKKNGSLFNEMLETYQTQVATFNGISSL